MGARSTRVLEMKKNFMALHLEGLSIAEIAEKYDLSRRSVYGYLDEIATENNISRKELLERDYPENRAERIDSERNNEKIAIDDIVSLGNDILHLIDSYVMQTETFINSIQEETI